MVQLQPSSKPEIIYPDRDGQPMSDNTKQFRWIVTIKENLDWLYASNPNVFVAGDLLWYPVEGDNKTRFAPDALIVFGRPKGDRGSYKQWEEDNIAPQVVFEILSPGNTKTEMNRKLLFYDRFGVEEYYLYDPDRNRLNGWVRTDGFLDLIEPIQNWVSPRLQIRFELTEAELQIYRPDGKSFLTYTAIAQTAELAEARAEFAEERAELAEERAELAEERAELAEERSAKFAEKLREMGIDPDRV
jgi:Uma2 family endonuclease